MNDPDQFTVVFGAFVYRSAYTPGQLAGLTTVPKTTIINWLNGRVVRPRGWHGIVEVAAALRLTEAEANQLLAAARQPAIRELRDQPVPAAVARALSFWQTAEPAPAAPPFQAVPLLPYFVAREAERARLVAELSRDGPTPVALLYGMAGVGKTSLAARVAYDLRDHFADGVLWARLDSSDTLSILASFAAAFQGDVSNCLDVASRSGVVRDLLSTRHTLIVLDNAQTSEQIEPLLPPTGRCAVLVTSQRQDLAALAGARRVVVRPFAPDAAASLALFGRILGTERVLAEQESLERIADELGHLPLALAITASRLAYEPDWQTAQFEDRLQRVSRRLEALRYETQSVRRSFQISYEWLDESARQLFGAAGMLGKQDFAAEALAALTTLEMETVEDGLRQLHSLSLVQSAGDGRYGLHPLLHDFARELSATDGLGERLVGYWTAFLAANRYRPAAVMRELGHIQAALETAVVSGWLGPLRGVVDGLLPTLFTQGAHTLAEEYLEQAAPLVEKSGDAAAHCWLLLRLGQLANQRHELDTADEHLRAGLQLARQQQEPSLEAQLLTELGVVQNCYDHTERGKAFLVEALPLTRQTGQSDSMLVCLEELGILALMVDDDEEADRYYQEGLAAARAQNNEAQLVLFCKSLGALRQLQGEPAEARRLFEEGFALSQHLGYHKGLMLLGNNLAVSAAAVGESAEAGGYLHAALAEAQRLRDEQAQSVIQMNLGRLAEGQVRLKLFI